MLGTATAATGTTQTIPGDFNGDGWPDLLLQPADASGQVRITLADGAGNLTIPGQTWAADYLGLHWSADNSQLVSGDFTGDGRSDVLLQPLQPGDTGAVLLADPNGQFHTVNQLIATPYMELDWSAASHHILVGGFTGNGRQDVLLQTTAPGGMNMIVEPNAQGILNTTGQTWPDGYLGLQWSTQVVTLYTGDFTGNGRTDLLLQVTDPASDTQVPAYALLLSDSNGDFTQINQSWGVDAFGADWSPATHQLLIEDVTGNGVDSIVLMSKDPNGSNYLFIGNQTGTFSKPDLTWAGTQSAKAAWAAKMAAGSSILVSTTSSSSQSSLSSHSPLTLQKQIVAPRNTQTPNTVGTMDGESGVNGGSAAYHISISVPPGRAGMQPSLSLNYSSTGGNGDLGVGWSLSGLSAITRCPATKAQDGYTQGVTYNATYDRLCLDGQHLIVVSGAYGQSGSIYRTELDSLVRVTLTGGSINSSAASFKVDYEDGRKAYYGTSTGTNTQFTASGASYPLVWAIAQEVDASGNNSIVYNYSAYGNGEYHIASIVYSGTTNREVDFTYTSRNDPSSVWLAGGLTRQTQLLTSITTYAASTEVQQYSLNYSPSNATGRNLLRNVQACGYNGNSALCMTPTYFTWQEPYPGFNSAVLLTVPSSVSTDSGGDSGTVGKQSYVTIDKDFDGDGQNELRYDNLNAGKETIFSVNNQSMDIELTDFAPGLRIQADDDFLSNGLADPMYPVGSIGNYFVGVATCTTQPCIISADFTKTTTTVPYNSTSIATGQFSGNGLVDIVVDKAVSSTSHAIYLYPNTSTNPNGAPSFNTSGVNLGPLASFQFQGYTYYEGFSEIGDLDGNGIPDLQILGSPLDGYSTPVAVAFIQNTSGTLGGTTATIKSLSSIGITQPLPTYYYFADINGDGLKDFIFVTPNSASPTWEYQLNEGGTFGPVVDTGVVAGNLNWASATPVTNFGTIQVGNFTNDGKDELLVPVTLVSTYCLIVKVMLEGGWQNVDYCGNQLFQHGYGGDDHSIYGFQILKFVEQANGTYVPTPVNDNNGQPVSITAEAGTVKAGDVYGFGLTDVFYLSSKWFNDGDYNLECTVGSPGCAHPPAKGYYTVSPSGGAPGLPGKAPDLLTGAQNGLGAQAAWTYDSLTDLKKSGAYSVDNTSGTRCSTAPNTPGQAPEYYCFTSSMWVVSNYSVSNDNGGMNQFAYAYTDAVYDNRGRGFQGFKSITTFFTPAGDTLDATTTLRSYRQDFPFSGSLINETVSQTGTGTGTVLSMISNTWPNPGGAANPTGCLPSTKVFWPQLQQSIVTNNGAGGENISTTTTAYTYDGYGNTTQIVASTADSTGIYGTTTNYLNNSPDCTNWWLDKFGEKTLTSTAVYNTLPVSSTAASISRTANYSYNTALRKLQEEYDDQSTAFEKDTTYGYDSYGNATSVTLSSPVTGISAIASRTTSSDYTGTGGYFADSITNAAGQTTTINPIDPGYGQPLGVTDPNGVVTTLGYDAFGRKILEQVTAPISLPATNIGYNPPDSLCAATAVSTVYEVTSAQAGYPGKTVCYDLLNHPLRTAMDGFLLNDPSIADTQYDSLGRVTRTYEPHNNETTTLYWNKVNQYDVLNRVLSKTDAEGVDTVYTYSGLTANATTTPHDTPAFTTVTLTNSLGKLLSTVDAKGSKTEFRYDAQGNPVLIKDAAGHQTLATYNTLGQKTAVTDPDMGHWTYVYDVLGNLKQQTDAKAQVISQSFDVLNRMISRIQPEGTTNWCYDGPSCTGSGTAPDIGKLYSVTQYDGYQKTYSYDGDGRVSNVHEVINGNGYDTYTTYDTDGRVNTVTYPQSLADAPPTVSAGSNQTVAPGVLVTLQGSGTASGGGPLPLSFQWTELSGPTVTLSNPMIATPTFTAGAAGSTYVFQLTGNDGLTSASATVTVTVLPLPSAPSGLTTDGDTDHNGIYLVSWNSVTVSGQTITYHLEQATGNSSGPTSAFTEIWSGTTASDSVNNSGNSSYYYYYRVRAQDLSGYSGYSATAGIHVVVMPSPTPTLSPFLKTVAVNTPYTESWTTAGPKVTAYNLYQANDPSFSGQTLVYSGTGISKSFSKTVADVDYYYRAQACNSSDGLTVCSAYSNTSHIYIRARLGGNSLTQPPASGTGTSAPAAQTSAAAATIPSAISPDPSSTENTALASSSDSTLVSKSTLPSTGDGYRDAGARATPGAVAANTSEVDPDYVAASDSDEAHSGHPLPTVGEGGGEGDKIALAAPDPHVAQARGGIVIHYGPPVYQAYANLHFEPAASVTTQVGLTVLYTYTSTGYLSQLSNAVDSNQVFWTANTMDAFGQISSETYGNGVVSTTISHNLPNGQPEPLGRITGIQSGSLQNLSYQWDHLGNLTYRSDSLSSGNVSESFGYDLLNRLLSAQVTNGSGVQPALSYAYDAIGDITSKSDTGSYTYGATRPHAVSSVAGVNPGSYAYDADGNMSNRNGTVITWNSDNMPTSIVENGSNSSSFSYAPDKHRYYQSAEIAGVAETTVYVGGYEAVTKNGSTLYRHHLMADGREVAEVDLSNSGSSVVQKVSYILSDHLGSVDVVTDSSGTPIAEMSFGAFGNRREPGSWLPPVTQAEAQADHNVDRYGFTHQEMLDNVNLIHMNGRVYDPQIGRFLSVDPVFEFPTNTQSLNPYSYVLNNPLSMTDPTGYTATDGSICTGPGGSSRGCAGQDLSDLKGQQLGKLFGQLQSAVHKAFGKNATVVGFGKTRDGQVAMALSFGNGSKNSQGTNIPLDQSADASSKGSPAATGQIQAGVSGASRLTSGGTVTTDDFNRLKAFEAEAVWHGYAALDDFKNSGKLPKEWQDFDPLDIFRLNYIVQPGFAERENAGTCSRTTNGCTEGNYFNGTVNIYGAALLTARDDNLRSMTGLTLHEFEHSTSYNLGLYREFFEWNGNDNARAILLSRYTIHDDLRWERDAIDFSNAAMRYYRP